MSTYTKRLEDPIAESMPSSDSLPRHLVRVPGGDWALWRWMCLRGAGFPFSMVAQMAAPFCAQAADKLLGAEAEAGQRRQDFVAAIRKQMDITRDSQRRKDLAGLLTALNANKKVKVQEDDLEPLRSALESATGHVEQARLEFQQAFQFALDEVSEKIKRVASDADFRRAMLMQNAAAVRLGLPVLRHDNTERGKKERQSQQLVANYLQRYCAKNDSIGFFGPVGWGRFSDHGPNVEARPGPSIAATSNIYFEHWAIDALADELSKDVKMRPWMAPRLSPEVCLNENHLKLPDGSLIELSPTEKAILGRCDGRRTARQIALDLSHQATNGNHSEQDFFEILLAFLSRKIITWKLEVPVVLHPERILRDLLERVEDEHLRSRALQCLDRLEQARDFVARAVGTPDELDVALEKLDAAFTGLTDKAATRYEGWNYSGRTVIYQDCLRDLQIEIGPDVIAQLGPPLSLFLASARWFSYEAAGLYRKAFQEAYEKMAADSQTGTIEMLPFWEKIRRLFTNPQDKLFAKLLPELQRRWEQVLRIPEGRQVQYASAELRSRVDEAFDAPRAGWSLARYHSPDVMISAESVEAIRRGDYQFVLGEVHICYNTIRPSWAMAQHPHPEEMFEAIDSDIPEDHVLIVPPKSFRRYSARARMVLISPRDYIVEIKEDALSWHPPSKTLPITAFVVEQGPTGLVAKTRDGRLKFDLVEFFGEALSNEAVEFMDPLRSRSHVPRLIVDRMVIHRESWSFPAPDLHFALAKDEAQRFLEVKRWQKKHELPRLVFVRVPVELKPFYVDFDSPIYVENLAKMVRKTLDAKSIRRETPIEVTEMLPTPGQIWLPDAQGQKYTCELRIVALDMKN